MIKDFHLQIRFSSIWSIWQICMIICTKIEISWSIFFICTVRDYDLILQLKIAETIYQLFSKKASYRNVIYLIKRWEKVTLVIYDKLFNVTHYPCQLIQYYGTHAFESMFPTYVVKSVYKEYDTVHLWQTALNKQLSYDNIILHS